MTSCLLQEVLVVILYHALPFFILVLFLLVNRHLRSLRLAQRSFRWWFLRLSCALIGWFWLVIAADDLSWFDVLAGRLTELQIEQTTTYRGRADQCFFNQNVVIYILIWISHYTERILCWWWNPVYFLGSIEHPVQRVLQSSLSAPHWRNISDVNTIGRNIRRHSLPFGDPVLISPNLETVSVVMSYKDPLVWSGSLRSILVSMLFWWSSSGSREDRSLRGGGLHGSRVWWLSCGRWWQKEAVINSGVSKGSSTKLPWAVRTDEQDKIPHIKCMYMSALSLFWHWLWHRLTVCSDSYIVG